MTLSTSDNNASSRAVYRRSALFDLAAAAVLILFGIVYEVNSFGIFSFYMIYAFVPIFGLGFAELILSFTARLPYDRLNVYLFRWGACAAVCGSIVRGILEIYGTSSEFLIWYPVFAYLFFAGGIARLIVRIVKARSRGRDRTH